jgi:hypothetical protein
MQKIRCTGYDPEHGYRQVSGDSAAGLSAQPRGTGPQTGVPITISRTSGVFDRDQCLAISISRIRKLETTQVPIDLSMVVGFVSSALDLAAARPCLVFGGVAWPLPAPIRHKAFMPHSYRRSHCSFTGKGPAWRESWRRKRRRTRNRRPDARKRFKQRCQEPSDLITLWRPNEVRPLLLSETIVAVAIRRASRIGRVTKHADLGHARGAKP